MSRIATFRTMRFAGIAAGVFTISSMALIGSVLSHDELNGRPHHIDAPVNPTATMKAFLTSKAGQTLPAEVNAAAQPAECVNGFADIYRCDRVDLNAFVPRGDIGGDLSNDEISDIWGWTDPSDGSEYALVGRVFGTSFVDVTDPDNPIYVGELPLHGTFGSPWRDIKVYKNFAFIVSEARNDGMQILDLTRLRGAAEGTIFTEDAHYSGFGSAHNLVINEESGYAYAVGSNTCSGGLEIVDIRDPLNPTDAGCFSGDGYTHDAQCVIYRGPDVRDTDGVPYAGREICFASNEDSLTIVDVTDKSNPQQIGKASYPNVEYTHQGWLNEDHTLFFFNDELDERDNNNVVNTTTRTWDVSDLEGFGSIDPSTFEHFTTSIDHNLYVEGRFIYQANYQSGLRIVDLNGDPSGAIAGPVAHFDVYPSGDLAAFNGAWSSYPYFSSGTVVVSHIEQGLFVLTPNIDRVAIINVFHGEVVSGDVFIDFDARDPDAAAGAAAPTVSLEVDDAPAAMSGGFWDSTTVANGLHRLTARMSDASGAVTLSTILVTVDNGGANTPPDVAITNPTDGAEISGNVTLSATATDTDGSVVAVDFYSTPDGGTETLIGSASQSGDVWSLNWNVKKVTNGLHTLRAEATDDDGAVTSHSISVTVASGGGNGGGGGGGGGGNCPPKKPGCS